MLKVVTDQQGLTPDVRRVMEAAATAQRRTGVPITTHTHAPSRNGRDQLALLPRPRSRARTGWSSVTAATREDLDYLRELMDAGATIGMDRFGMEHVLPDDARVATVLTLLRGRVRRPDGALPRRGVLQPGDATVLAGRSRAALDDGEHLPSDHPATPRTGCDPGPASTS